jgi:predicted GNAT family acetyltransferase
MDLDITHDAGKRRFTAVVDGHECEIDYQLSGEVMSITHTGVPQAIAGRGIAAQLMRAVLKEAEARGWKVIPACSYAADFMRKHPEYGHLLQAA